MYPKGQGLCCSFSRENGKRTSQVWRPRNYRDGLLAILGLSRSAHADGLNSLHLEQIITIRDGQADAIHGDDHTQVCTPEELLGE